MDNIRVGRFFAPPPLSVKLPSCHPCLIWQKWTKQHTDVMFRPMASIHQLHLMESNPSRPTHGKMSWGWISQGCYPKLMVRSSEVTARSNKLKTRETSLFLLLLLQLCSLEMSMMARSILDPNHGPIPRKGKRVIKGLEG